LILEEAGVSNGCFEKPKRDEMVHKVF
jgi:hypothetical protein